MFRTVILSVSLTLALTMTFPAFAGRVELTTYYPAPHGEYATLSSTQNSNFATTPGAKVGIGTPEPKAKLDVAGGVRVGSDSGGCSTGNQGTLRFIPVVPADNSTTPPTPAIAGHYQYCDGIGDWKNFGGAAIVKTQTGMVGKSAGGVVSRYDVTTKITPSFTPRAVICGARQIGRFGGWGHYYCDASISGKEVSIRVFCTYGDCGRATFNYMIVGD